MFRGGQEEEKKKRVMGVALGISRTEKGTCFQLDRKVADDRKDATNSSSEREQEREAREFLVYSASAGYMQRTVNSMYAPTHPTLEVTGVSFCCFCCFFMLSCFVCCW